MIVARPTLLVALLLASLWTPVWQPSTAGRSSADRDLGGGRALQKHPQASSQADGEAASRRWLVRLRLRQLAVRHATVQGRRASAQAWTTPSASEFVIRVNQRAYVIDAQQGLLFQVPLSSVNDQAQEFELLLPYPAPRSDQPVDDLIGAVELLEPEITIGLALVPHEGPFAEAGRGEGEISMLPPVREFLQVFRIGFVAGTSRVEVLFDDAPEAIEPGYRR